MTPPPSLPPPIPSSPTAPELHNAEARARELRSEAAAVSDRALKAALLYEAAYLTETALRQPAQAVQEYLAAYNLDHRFRLPLYALLRLFERRRSFKNLSRLYDAELRSARAADEKSVALVDQAVLAAISGGEHEVVRACLERALEQSASTEAALLLEWNRAAAHDTEAALAAMLKRAESCDDPLHRGVLLLEVASHRERLGEVGAALEALKAAALGPHAHEAFLVALARFARTHNFVPELVEATERRADSITSELQEALSAESPDELLIERLRAHAVALWYEAARLRSTSLSDAEGALACISRALSIRPDDLLLRQTRMLAYDLMEDRERAADEARALLAQGVEGEHAAALHFRLAEHALVQGDSDAARESLMEAIAQAGGSIAADAILDDLLLDEERHRERIERREARAATADAARAARWLLEAAQIAAHELKDAEKAAELFKRADAKSEGNLEVLREAYGAALELGHDELARFAIDRLLSRELDDDERAALVHHRLEVAESPEEANALIEKHLDDPRMRGFLPYIARLRAAESKSYELLRRAHELLAEQAVGTDEIVAHLCAAARASLRAQDTPRARTLLERALERAPAHRYALALLEEVLRTSGENAGVVELLRKAAVAQASARDAEMSLLLAGAAAEAAGDFARAAQSYEEAADRNPASVGPLWALLRLGERTDDAALVLRAREAIAMREKSEGRASVESLLLADHYELVSNKPELAEAALESMLSDATLSAHAAIGLVLSRSATPELRERALRALIERSSGSLAPLFKRELGGLALARSEHGPRLVELVDHVTAARSDDRWAAFTRALLPLPGAPREHVTALSTLAALTSDVAFAEATRAEALAATKLADARAPLAESTKALGLDEQAPLSGAVAHALAAGASPVRDAALRARALSVVAVEAPPEHRGERVRALSQSLLAAGDADGAVDALRTRLDEVPDDLAALELMRVAARRAGRFDEVANAAERLAERVQGELWAELLEESAAVRMDVLDDAAGAERLLDRVLARHPNRPIAYGRLHDLVSERGDTNRLRDLVSARTELIDDPEELARLFYELARLERAAGDLEAALDALDHLSMLEEHVGGLALAVEIHSARESWAEAVDALTALAEAEGVPKTQRRLARLGAADFLEHRLKDGAGALAQLDKLVEQGHGDSALFTRMADVAERLGQTERAASALRQAAELAKGDTRIDLSLRCAALLAKAGHATDAAALYQRAIEARPGHVGAVRALVSLSADESTRASVLSRFETAIRAEARAHPGEAEPLRKLLALAELKKQDDIAYVALSTLVAIGAANHGERELADAAMRRNFGARPTTNGALDRGDLKELLTPALDDKYAALLRAVLGSASDIDQLEPGRFGVGRGQRVSPREANQVRDEIVAMTSAVGLRFGELYVGGDDPSRLVAMPRDEDVAFVIGVGITSPLSPTRRYQLALQVSAAYLATLPLLSRTSPQAARLVFGALAAAEAPLPANIGREDLGELPRTLGRALPRKVKKALPDLVRALPDGGANAEAQCRTALRHTRRLALVLAGDLEAALEHVLGAMPPPEAIQGSDDALDLVRAFTGAPMTALRKKLGLAR